MFPCRQVLLKGNARYSIKEQIHFIEIALGSLMEVYCQLTLAYDLYYITEKQLKLCKEKIEEVHKLLKRDAIPKVQTTFHHTVLSLKS